MTYHASFQNRLTLLAPALAIVGMSYWHYSKNINALNNCLANVESCQRLAAEIDLIRQAPQRARLTTRSADDQGAAVEKAASKAHLARDRVLRIDPQPPKRLGKSDYLEQATEIELLAVSLRQLVELTFNLGRGDSELAVGTLRLRMPHEAEQAGPELWLADIVLTQRIYAPTTQR